jgi:hypothetical protein
MAATIIRREVWWLLLSGEHLQRLLKSKTGCNGECSDKTCQAECAQKTIKRLTVLSNCFHLKNRGNT